MQRKLKIGIIALVALLTVSAVAANTFYFHFTQTPYFPGNYNWMDDWTVKEVIDFVEADLTLTGSGYQYDPHDYVLILENVATEPNYVITSMDYSATWVVGGDSEDIVTGTYSGGLLIGKTAKYAGTFTPMIFGEGKVHMDITEIVWAVGEPITWTKDTESHTYLTIEDYEITGATISMFEPGSVAFTISCTSAMVFDLKVEIVEPGIIIAEQTEINIIYGETLVFNFDFDPVPSSGDLTMLITTTKS